MASIGTLSHNVSERMFPEYGPARHLLPCAWQEYQQRKRTNFETSPPIGASHDRSGPSPPTGIPSRRWTPLHVCRLRSGGAFTRCRPSSYDRRRRLCRFRPNNRRSGSSVSRFRRQYDFRHCVALLGRVRGTVAGHRAPPAAKDLFGTDRETPCGLLAHRREAASLPPVHTSSSNGGGCDVQHGRRTVPEDGRSDR